MHFLRKCLISLIVAVMGGVLGSVTAQDRPSAQINVEIKKGFIVVARGSIGTLKNLVFLVDTGTARTLVNDRIANELHLEGGASTVMVFDHNVHAKLVELPSLQLGPIYVESLKVVVMDLSDVARQFGIRADAVIGMDVLRRCSFTIKYKLRQIAFGSGEILRHSVQLKHAVEPYSVIEAQINGRVVSLMVDSGFDGLLLFSDRLPKEITRLLPEIKRRASGVAGQVSLSQAPAAELKIGDLRASKVSPLVVETGGRSMGAFEGILGARALKLLSIRFDYERNILSWE
jgi:predicted aspartyl protease